MPRSKGQSKQKKEETTKRKKEKPAYWQQTINQLEKQVEKRLADLQEALKLSHTKDALKRTNDELKWIQMQRKSKEDHQLTEESRPFYEQLVGHLDVMELQVKVVQSQCLWRLERLAEARRLLDQVADAYQPNQLLYNAMVSAYREVGDESALVRLSEEMVKKLSTTVPADGPFRDNVLHELFFAYARLGRYADQARLTCELAKLKPDSSMYYFWNVMSTFMQSIADSSSLKHQEVLKKVALNRTEQFIKKQGQLSAKCESELYLMILESAGQHETAINYLRNHQLCQHIDETTRQVRTCDHLLQMARYQDAIDGYKTLIGQFHNDFTFYNGYLHCAQRLIDDGLMTVDQCVDYLQELIESVGPTGWPSRNGYLAKLELLDRLAGGHRRFDQLAHQFLTDYFQVFGSKPCFSFDVKKYLETDKLLDGRNWTNSHLSSMESSREDELFLPTDLGQLNQHLNLILAQGYCGIYRQMSRQQLLNFVEKLVHWYNHGINLTANESSSSSSGRQFDMKPADPYLLLAVHLIFIVYQMDCAGPNGVTTNGSQGSCPLASISSQELLWKALRLVDNGLRHSQFE